MGKKDAAQRTKGNTVAASSARSAQYLGEDVGFVGFGTSTETAYVPILVNANDPTDDVPADMRVVLRKMHKKDLTTKVKALSEFQELSEKMTESEMVSVLPFWSSVYTKLANDVDARVREQSHTCLQTVVTRVGRALATCLKTICGVWYLGMFDSHPAAASAASAAWTAAFPPHKQAGAISFCHPDIVALITENLTLATPQTLSDPNTTSAEDMEAKYCRTLAMSFAALSDLIQKTPAAGKSMTGLLADGKFWKYARNKSNVIRQGFYELMFQVCAVMPAVACSNAAHLCPAVLTSLGEAELGPATAVWTAALVTLQVVTAAWGHVNINKAVLPPVYKLLTAGGNGMAVHLYTNLMPFLSRIPTETLRADDNKICHRWLTSLNTGLQLLLESAKPKLEDELEAVINAYVECVVYFVTNEDFDEAVRAEIMEEHLLDNLLIKSLKEKKLASGLNKCQIAKFISPWETKGSMSKLNSVFWGKISHQMVNSVEQGIEMGPSLLMLSQLSFEGQDSLSSVSSLKCKLWEELNRKLEHNDQREHVESKLYAISNIANLLEAFDLKRNQKLSKRLFPENESVEKYLNKNILPLLGEENISEPTLQLTISLTKMMNTEQACDILVKCSSENNREKIMQHTLTLLSKDDDQELLEDFLNQPTIKEQTLGYILKAESDIRNTGEYDASIICAIAKQNLVFTNEEQETILSKMKDGIASFDGDISTKYFYFVGLIAKTISRRSKVDWSEGVGADVAIALFKHQINKSYDDVWLEACEKSSMETKLWTYIKEYVNIALGAETTSLTVFNQLFSKCQPLLINRSMEEVASFLSLNRQNETYDISEYVIDQEMWTSQDPSIAKDSSNIKPKLFLCQLIRAKYFPVIATSDNSCDTIADCDRVELPVHVASHVVDTIVCYCHNIRHTEDEFVAELKQCLDAMVPRLSKQVYTLARDQLRQLSLREGGVYCVALCWLVRTVYTASEWSPGLSSLLPGHYDSWSDGELTTIHWVMRLCSDMAVDTQLFRSTADLVIAVLVSLGGTPWSQASDRLLWLLAQCITLSSRDQLDTMTSELQSVLLLVQSSTNDNKDALLYNRSLAEVSWQEAGRVSSLALFLSSIIAHCPQLLTPETWDLVCCSLVSWSASIQESVSSLSSPPVSRVTAAVCRLSTAMGELLADKTRAELLPAKLSQEWEEFFAEGVYSVLVPVYVSVAGDDTLSQVMRKWVASAVVSTPAQLLLSAQLLPLHLVQDVDITTPLPDNITFLYNHLAPLLLSQCRHTQVSASALLTTVASNTIVNDDTDDDDETREIPRRLTEVIKQGDIVLDTLMEEWRVGECVGPIPPGNTAHTVTVGYLLAWSVVIALLEAASDELRPKYTEYLKTSGYLDSLMGHLFKLLPRASTQEMFNSKLDVASEADTADIYKLAGACWLSVCRQLPAVCRGWWQSLDKVGKEAVEKVTSGMVTPLLWQEERLAIASADQADNMVVRVRDSVKEVVATYTIDEGSLELVISLPSNHPLGGLSVDTGNRIGVDMAQWRKWMLQLTTFLSYQNGTIMGGLQLWKKNVDKRFEGVEECYICFYILHGSNHQLPKLGCRTCKKKFHSACLYKWFSTSNNSTCPLCRNLF